MKPIDSTRGPYPRPMRMTKGEYHRFWQAGLWAAPGQYRAAKDEIGWADVEALAAKRNGSIITR